MPGRIDIRSFREGEIGVGMIYRKGGKRCFDLVGAGFLVVLLAPLLIALAVTVAAKLGRPILFRQLRPGRGARLFTLFKFRSMSDQRDSSGELLPDDLRLGRFGRFLRSTSLDELPELWNVIRGEMSLVGPRPLLPQYVDRYTRRQARRMEVRPGITGWAQVKGRNALDWRERFELDVWYVDHVGFWLDLKILFLTLRAVLGRKGIAGEGTATMREFRGTGAESDRSP